MKTETKQPRLAGRIWTSDLGLWSFAFRPRLDQLGLNGTKSDLIRPQKIKKLASIRAPQFAPANSDIGHPSRGGLGKPIRVNAFIFRRILRLCWRADLRPGQLCEVLTKRAGSAIGAPKYSTSPSPAVTVLRCHGIMCCSLFGRQFICRLITRAS